MSDGNTDRKYTDRLEKDDRQWYKVFRDGEDGVQEYRLFRNDEGKEDSVNQAGVCPTCGSVYARATGTGAVVSVSGGGGIGRHNEANTVCPGSAASVGGSARGGTVRVGKSYWDEASQRHISVWHDEPIDDKELAVVLAAFGLGALALVGLALNDK